MFEKLTFTDENGDKAEFYIIEQTRVNNTDYLLVTDSVEDDEAEAMIVKDMSSSDAAEAMYEIVEDEEELKSLSGIFNELLEDIDIE